jgi:hypothetical protein
MTEPHTHTHTFTHTHTGDASGSITAENTYETDKLAATLKVQPMN